MRKKSCTLFRCVFTFSFPDCCHLRTINTGDAASMTGVFLPVFRRWWTESKSTPHSIWFRCMRFNELDYLSLPMSLSTLCSLFSSFLPPSAALHSFEECSLSALGQFVQQPLTTCWLKTCTATETFCWLFSLLNLLFVLFLSPLKLLISC